MSVFFLRQATLNRTICSTSFVSRPLGSFAQKLVVDRSQSSGGGSAIGPSVAAKGPSRHRKSTQKSGDDLVPSKDPLADTPLELYLKKILESGSDPTLLDIERCRPERHTENVESMRYVEEYNALVEKLCRSFSRRQLREFTILYNLDLRAIRTKHQFAELIIEKQWKWPSLKEVQKRHRDRTEISVKTFPVNPTQLFLILGKDGAELLQMSQEYNVHIAVTRSPLALKVEGLRPSLSALSEHITAVKNAIVEETLQLPGGKPIKQDLIQPISRIADAYVQNLGDDGTIRICAKRERNVDLAKRLVTRASFESAESSRTTLLSYLPAGVGSSTQVPKLLFPHTYSVYPFLSPRSLPWTMKSGGAFRIKRVVEWLDTESHEDIRATGGLAGESGRILSIDNKELALKDILLGELSKPRDDGASSQIVTASFGHILLPSATSSQRASIVPPFKGFWPFAKILAWMENNRTETTFVPSLPMQFLNSAPNQQKYLVRFFYHALSESSSLPKDQGHSWRSQPTKMIKFELVLAHSGPTKTISTSEPPLEPVADIPSSASLNQIVEEPQSHIPVAENGHLFSSEAHKFVRSVRDNKIDRSNDAANIAVAVTPEESLSTPIGPRFSASPQCWVGVETTVNLILPDRPMDIRFTAFDHIALQRDEEPEELRSYSSALQSFLQGQDMDGDEPTAPIPPNTFMYNGEAYFLHKSASIRQSDEPIPGLTVDDSIPGASARVVNESILDLESQQKSSVCELLCVDHNSDGSWQAFLGNCDRLTSALYPSVDNDGADAKSSDLDID